MIMLTIRRGRCRGQCGDGPATRQLATLLPGRAVRTTLPPLHLHPPTPTQAGTHFSNPAANTDTAPHPPPLSPTLSPLRSRLQSNIPHSALLPVYKVSASCVRQFVCVFHVCVCVCVAVHGTVRLPTAVLSARPSCSLVAVIVMSMTTPSVSL